MYVKRCDSTHARVVCMTAAGCTNGWVNYANEPSQAALERSSQDAHDDRDSLQHHSDRQRIETVVLRGARLGFYRRDDPQHRSAGRRHGRDIICYCVSSLSTRKPTSFYDDDDDVIRVTRS